MVVLLPKEPYKGGFESCDISLSNNFQDSLEDIVTVHTETAV